jgi:hypothetical protein
MHLGDCILCEELVIAATLSAPLECTQLLGPQDCALMKVDNSACTWIIGGPQPLMKGCYSSSMPAIDVCGDASSQWLARCLLPHVL